ncbi:MAG: trimethylamine corrinoid protein 2 [Armatimonadota bacterium]
MMYIDRIPDWEQRIARADAFWNREIIDRPFVCLTTPNRDSGYAMPAAKSHATLRERWMDAEYNAECALAWTMNTAYYGDALPAAYPNLGPEVFSAFFGCELEFGNGTTWSIPNLEDWTDVDKVRFSEDNVYWKKMNEMTDAFLEAGKGKFYTGLTDLHPGGDAITAFRDPYRLNIDMIEAVDEVKSLLRYVNDVYFYVFDHFCDKLITAGQPITTWMPIPSTRRWYVPSNDFSCMISKQTFDDIFLPGIVEECRHTEASIYHLDGPGALQHLDSLLSIDELNAIQWVYGSGNGRATDWLDIYQKCQSAGKGIQIGAEPDELDMIMEHLQPEGVMLTISADVDKESAEAIIRKVSDWR